VTNRAGGTIVGLVDLGEGDDRLRLETGSSLDHAFADGGSGLDQVELIGAGTGSYGGYFPNFESLFKRDDGIWTLTSGTAASPFEIGTTVVESGTLRIDGFMTSQTRIEPRGTLGGNGILSGVLTNHGGTIAPGGSLGTLTLESYAEASPSTHFFEIDAAGNHDKLFVQTTHELFGPAPESTLRVTALQGDYETGGQVYDIIVAGEGRTGMFDSQSHELEGADAKLLLEYQPSAVRLTSLPMDFSSMGETPNQSAIGGYLDQLLPVGICESDLCFAARDLSLAGNVAETFAQLDPEAYDAYVTVAFAQARMFSEASRPRTEALRRSVRRDAPAVPQRQARTKPRVVKPNPPAPVAVDLNNGYALQLLAGLDHGTLPKLPQLQIFEEYRLYTTTYRKNRAKWRRLRLGFFATKRSARRAQRMLEEHFPGVWVTRVSREEREASAATAIAPPGSTRIDRAPPTAALRRAPATQHPKRTFLSVRPEGKVNVWLHGVGALGEKNGTGSHIDYDYDTFGGIAGLDFRLGESVLLGAMAGWERTDLTWGSGRASEGRADAGQIGLYASYSPERWFVDGMFGYGINDFSTTSRLGVPVDRVATSSHDGSQLMARLALGYQWDLGRGWQLDPALQAGWVHLNQTSPDVMGEGPFAVELHENQYDSLTTMVGLRVSKVFTLERVAGMTLAPELRAGYLREWLDVDRTMNASFVGQSTEFTIQGDAPSPNGLTLGSGLVLFADDRVSLRLGYSADLRSNSFLQVGTVGARVRFR
jgi:outer membrane autotransporter protein